MARPNSYKTRRKLTHCRIDVVTTRRNAVVNPSYLVQNSQTTRALSYICRYYPKKCLSKSVISRTKLADVHCRIDVVTTWRNTVVNPSYLGIIPYCVAASRTGPVITRTMSPWSTGGPEHTRTYDKMRNVYENYTTIYGWVTRSVREKLRPFWTPGCGEIFKPFKNLVGSPRQCTRYGDMLREQPTLGDISAIFLRHVASS